jgi:hypothetical protein
MWMVADSPARDREETRSVGEFQKGGMMKGRRAAVRDALTAVAFVLIAVWGVINLSESDWFIGGVMTVSAVIGLWSLGVRGLQARRRRPRGPFPPANKPAG